MRHGSAQRLAFFFYRRYLGDLDFDPASDLTGRPHRTSRPENPPLNVTGDTISERSACPQCLGLVTL